MTYPILFRPTGAALDSQYKHVREIEGCVGFWPFARTMRFCVGVNCDAIECRRDGVFIYRRGRLVARSASRLGRPPGRIRRLSTDHWLRTLTLP